MRIGLSASEISMDDDVSDKTEADLGALFQVSHRIETNEYAIESLNHKFQEQLLQ